MQQRNEESARAASAAALSWGGVYAIAEIARAASANAGPDNLNAVAVCLATLLAVSGYIVQKKLPQDDLIPVYDWTP